MTTNWQKELKQLKLAWMEKHHHDFFNLSGGWQQKLKSYSDHNTNALTASIYDFLKYCGFYVNRINSQGQMRKINGKMQWTHGSSNLGTCDVHAIINGQSIHIEVKCKTTGDRMRKEQYKERERVQASGGVYLVVEDMPGFISWYNEFVNNKHSMHEPQRQNTVAL